MNLRLDASDTHGNSSSSSLAHPTFSTFFFNATPTTEIYTLSLHDALPISDDGHFIVGAHAPLHLRRGVIHTRVLEPVQVVRRQLPIGDTGGDDDGARQQRVTVPVVEQHAEGLAVARESDRALGDQDLGAELLS